MTRFLTGFPGFLGAALVSRLLARSDGAVTCLVQPAYRDVAERRADELTAEADAARDRITLVEGDITDPNLGLTDYDAIRRETAVVYHLAALYDLGAERGPAERVNVDGTDHVLDFAADAAVERLHYVSTCYVSGRYDGTFTHADLDVGQSFNNHYERTKFEAERAVRARMADGLPVTVYRPAIAVGDSETGETRKYDGPYYLLSLLRRQPRLAFAPAPPRPDAVHLNVVPRDFVVDAIAELSGRPETVGEVYQLCNPHPPTVGGVIRKLGRAADRRAVPVPGTANPSYELLDRFPGLAGRLGVEPETLPYFSHPTTYTDANTRRALAGTGVRCPLFESYVDRLVAYVRDHPDLDADAMA
ncbi:SDR family oxidoreductase [Haloarcula nitratireducens]|uniref:SDR family oxidoreductase n=1 Tax=Haloarcula nitratireducens TaxID=2487749 RepID=A0AAW4PA36_9EURY|nr:SDR family oxidoreductase [Halomicroarcula nitratireducens]MBX0294759.1 SDR family oxidoreductase [Halomicroarcula nitratireducens]